MENHDQVQQELEEKTQDTKDIEMVRSAQSPNKSLVNFSWKGGAPPRWLVLLAPIALNVRSVDNVSCIVSWVLVLSSIVSWVLSARKKRGEDGNDSRKKSILNLTTSNK